MLLEIKVVSKIIFCQGKNLLEKEICWQKNLSEKKKICQKNFLSKKILVGEKIVADFVADFVSDKSMFIFYSTYNKTP